jgi:hypothetical protein
MLRLLQSHHDELFAVELQYALPRPKTACTPKSAQVPGNRSFYFSNLKSHFHFHFGFEA